LGYPLGRRTGAPRWGRVQAVSVPKCRAGSCRKKTFDRGVEDIQKHALKQGGLFKTQTTNRLQRGTGDVGLRADPGCGLAPRLDNGTKTTAGGKEVAPEMIKWVCPWGVATARQMTPRGGKKDELRRKRWTVKPKPNNERPEGGATEASTDKSNFPHTPGSRWTKGVGRQDGKQRVSSSTVPRPSHVKERGTKHKKKQTSAKRDEGVCQETKLPCQIQQQLGWKADKKKKDKHREEKKDR